MKDFANFLAIARGSVMEVETLIMVALRRKYVSDEKAAPALALVTEISNMLTSLRKRIIAPRREA